MTWPTGSTMSEKAFQALVIQTATAHGWEHYHPHNSQRSRAGYPDLTLWHHRPPRFMLRELKTATGKVSPEQASTIATLKAAGVDVDVWRPDDWVAICKALGK